MSFTVAWLKTPKQENYQKRSFAREIQLLMSAWVHARDRIATTIGKISKDGRNLVP